MKTVIHISLFVALAAPAHAEDWPTYGHDNRRSHVTSEKLNLPLTRAWARISPHPPQTAWTAPARWDAFAGNEGLQSMRNFDPAFFVTAVGDRVYFGSSVDNAVHCLDAQTGKETWRAFADSAVRLPPTIHDGHALFGSDDGLVYCVKADTGEKIWRFRPAEGETRLIPSNGKLISPWPVRTGVLVEPVTGAAYFGASLFPWEKSILAAVDYRSGKPRFVQKQTSVTLQGALLASRERLYVPQGRSAPLVFDKATGKRLADVKGSGGVWCILTASEELIAMPQNQKKKEDTVQLTNAQTRESILAVAGANRMLAFGPTLIVHQRQSLKKIDRQTKKSAWETRQPVPSALILAGDTIFLGGNGIITAVHLETGEQTWTAGVEGRVYGLAVANGRLLASTDHGHVICFE
ncbi:MAG: PQQ-binding-like beta-propeller repeat protein [Verrucomicrobiales bacterium]|nr:PQQ-binding-like beta-propeller repeat protein [Verrucomicrobiales bacterium]